MVIIIVGGGQMIDKIIRAIISISGMFLGVGISSIFIALDFLNLGISELLSLVVSIGLAVLFGILFFILSPKIIRKGKRVTEIIENELQKFPTSDIVLGSLGLIVGLVIAFFFSKPLEGIGIPYIGFIGQIILFGFFGYLGVKVATRKKEDITSVMRDMDFKRKVNKDKNESEDKREDKSYPKILDTSVIIDGRIADICQTDFIEGPLIIPEFVLEELQHIADSANSLKRNRGRRGLDILKKMQNGLDMEIIIHDKKFEDIQEVDSKLLKLTQLLQGRIITNDYNLNKVAEVQGIKVLNINELANAVKPVVLPGEEMVVLVVKDGKEAGQGLAYLDDGTMRVVESGKKFIDKTIEVVVTSVLQTSAGRMIFAKPKSMINKAV